jgi:parallel beta-helix repeat protein
MTRSFRLNRAVPFLSAVVIVLILVVTAAELPATSNLLAAEIPADSASRPLAATAPTVSYRNQILTEDTAWRGEVLVEGSITVAPQATLSIEAGTIVRFRSSSAGELPLLMIQGRCVATGTREKLVLFTSQYNSPQNGDWQGVVVLASEKKNLFEYCRIEGATTGIEGVFSNITLKNSIIEKCLTGARFQDCILVQSGGVVRDCGNGVVIADTEADMRDLNVSGNSRGLVVSRSSLYLSGATLNGNGREALLIDHSRVKIISNSIVANDSGITLQSCEGTVTNNRLNRNTEHGLSLVQSRIKAFGNEISANARFGLRVEDGRGVAWGNAIHANGLNDLYNGGEEDFRAIGNWWGVDKIQEIEKRIHDQRSERGRGKVLFQPMLKTKPLIGS